MRVLHNPTPTDGGGGAPVAQPPAQQPPAQQPPAANAQQFVSVPLADFQTLMGLPAKLAQYETEKAQAARENQERVTAALVAKGEAENAVKSVRTQFEGDLAVERQKLAATESRAKAYALRSELSTVLANLPLLEGAAAQLAALWAGAFEVHPDGEGFVVRTSTFQSVADVARSKLALPEYQHFLRPQTQGGAGAGNSHIPQVPGQPQKPPPGTYQEQVVADFQARQQATNNPLSVYGRSFGLGRGQRTPATN